MVLFSCCELTEYLPFFFLSSGDGRFGGALCENRIGSVHVMLLMDTKVYLFIFFFFLLLIFKFCFVLNESDISKLCCIACSVLLKGT